MEGFLLQQSQYVGIIRRAVQRDLCALRLLEKNEAWMRPLLKHRVQCNLSELQRCEGVLEWVLERPDDAGSIIIKV